MPYLCHFPDGSDGVYHVEQERLLKGTLTTIVGVDGLWVITEMAAPDEAEAIDAELWLREATDEELTRISGIGPETP